MELFARLGLPDAGEADYRNRFVAVPAGTAIVPRELAPVRSMGPQTARVVGLPEAAVSPTREHSEVPSLYVPSMPGVPFDSNGADAITAGMVNMLVLGTHALAPKPFGPFVAGIDVFEEHLRNLLRSCGLNVTYIDDWDAYHLLNGEVHCGTNTLRRQDPNAKWWHFQG